MDKTLSNCDAGLVAAVLKEKSSRNESVNIRIDKTVPSGTRSSEKSCNENCVFDRKRGIDSHGDNSRLGEGAALENDAIVRIVQRVSEATGEVIAHVAGNGEPTLLGDELVDLVAGLKSSDAVRGIKLTTNGTLLAGGAEPLAASLRKAGLDSATISLHSLSPMGFREVTGIDGLGSVLKGIEASLECNLPIGINCIVREETLSELDSFLRLSREKKIKIKFFRILSDNPKDQPIYDALLERLAAKLELMADGSYAYALPYTGRLFSVRGAIAEVKDSVVNNCPNMKCGARKICMEGCRYQIRLSRDGILQPCAYVSDNQINMASEEVSDKEIVSSLRNGGKLSEGSW